MSERKVRGLDSALKSAFGDETFLSFTLANNRQPDPQFQLRLNDDLQVELWANGVLVFEPKDVASRQRNVLISCGIHGNETAPMEIVDRLVSDILEQKIWLQSRLMIVIGNPQAAVEQERFCEQNLNRMFSGKHAEDEFKDSLEADRAKQLEILTERFFKSAQGHCIHYDLHTAIRGSRHEKFAVYPKLHDRVWSLTQLGFLETCGIEAVLLSNQPSTTYSYYTSTEFNADAFTVELGSVRPFGENDLAKFSAVEKGLRHLLSGEVVFETPPRRLITYSVIEEIFKRSDQLQFSFADDEKNFTAFNKGQVLVTDGDFNYQVAQDGERIVFPHKGVPVGQRALLVVAPYKISN